MHNAILFGEAGCGKSSVVNMTVGKDVADVSSGLIGCTLQYKPYVAAIVWKFHGTQETDDVDTGKASGTPKFQHIDNIDFVIYDTPGLNEGDQGRVPQWKAVRQLYTLIRQLDGVSLLIYCILGRFKENTRANWILFNKITCEEKVPTIVVVTGLEAYEDPDDW